MDSGTNHSISTNSSMDRSKTSSPTFSPAGTRVTRRIVTILPSDFSLNRDPAMKNFTSQGIQMEYEFSSKN